MFKKILATTMASAMIVSALSTPTNAANSLSEDGSMQSLVTAQIASSWIVTVPDSIVLDANKTANYEVSISGDVAKDTSVSVVPESSFTLTNGNDSVTANVVQEKQQWLGSEISSGATSTVGSIAVSEEMSAGNWAGTLNFNVNCTEDLGDLLAKKEMMNNLNVYCLGDSIVAGYVGSGLSYYGTDEALDNLYGTNTHKSFAATGATLTNIYNYVPSVVQQAQSLSVTLTNCNGFNASTAIIIDGGINDVNNYVESGDVVIKGFGAEHNMGNSAAMALYGIMSLVTNNATNLDAPIIYVLPNINYPSDSYNELKEVVESLKTTYPNLITIDCSTFITESDMADDVHMNSSGQTKLAHKIVDALYEFYN